MRLSHSLDRSQFMLVKSTRIGLLVCISAIFLIFQANQPNFINSEVLIPVFTLLSISFLINSYLLIFFERVMSKIWVNGFVFAYDAVCIFALAFYTGKLASIFIFLFLVNIILCGIVYRRDGAFNLSLWTSILFSVLVIFSGAEAQANIGTSLVVNNLSFFAVALLSGMLGHQIKHLDETVGLKEQQIQRLTHFNDLIVENIGTGLVTINRIGQITHSNPAIESLFKAKGLNDQNIYDYLPGLKGELKKDRLKPAVNRIELEWEGADHHKILEVIWSPTYDHMEAFHGYVLLIQDLTKVKSLERAMRQQEKLAAVGQLATGIAHEIRNPLASISGSIQLLTSENPSLTDDEKRLMGIVTREIDRLNHLISEFLEYVKPSDVEKEPVYVNKVLSEVLDMVRFNRNLPKDIKQATEFGAKEVIYGHHGKLKQALLNIVINAYQSMSESDDGVIGVRTFEDEDRVIIEIEDTGEGMEDVSRIFEPFHTTKPKGTGLGLAVTYKILEGHDAEVNVKSKRGVGTTFILKFPVSPLNREGQEMQRYA